MVRFVSSIRLRFLSLLLTTLLLAGSLVHAEGDKPFVTPGDAWPMFRGNTYLTGVTATDIPEKPELLWKFKAGDGIDSSAAIVGDLVYFGSYDENVYAVDFETGEQKWKTKISGPASSSPCVSGGKVFIGDEFGGIHGLDAATGAEIWKVETDAEVLSSPNCIGDRVWVGSYDQSLYCLEAATGKVIWKKTTEGPVHSTPGIVDGTVIVAGCDGIMHLIKAEDGTETGKIELGSQMGAAAARVGNRVYAGNYDNTVDAFDLTKLAIIWKYDPQPKDFPFYSSAALGTDRIVVGGRDRTVHCIAMADGTPFWTFNTKGRVDSSPLISGARVFVGSNDGNLYGLDLATGKEFWRYEAGAPIAASPAAARGRLIVGSGDGILYCFGGKGKTTP